MTRSATLALALALALGQARAQEPKPADDPAVRAFPSVVKIYGAGGFEGVPAYGTGVIVDERGFVLTSWSISLRTDQLKVVTHDGRHLKATVWRADPGLGVALVKVEFPPPDPRHPDETVRLRALPLGDSKAVRAGDEVRAIGNPFGIIYGAEAPAVAEGVVTYVGPLRSSGVHVLRLPERLERVIVTDIPSNPGTQGGPLIARDGSLVGICGRFVESRATNTIINYAVPVDLVADLVREGVESDHARPDGPRGTGHTERVAPADSGVRLQRVSLARPPMAYVEAVVRGSPAATAGLLEGDLVFRVDGRTIRTTRDWDEALSGRGPGEVLHLVVKRGDHMLRFDVTLAPAGWLVRLARSATLTLVLALAGAWAARAQDAAPVGSPSVSCALSPEDEAALEVATRQVVAEVAPSVVEVECLGGLEEEFKAPEDESQAEGGVLAKKGFKQAFGPTTGLIVSKDGLILTTTFAVRREPRHIIVTLADGRSFVAKVRGQDEGRSLVLLSIEAKDLPVPRMATPAEVRTGRFAIALGRGLGGDTPAVSRGIISAVGRVGGLALQSSAAISPVNYGGPLVAIDGAVLGILVPLAMTGGMASVDVYDSGIGFAVPAPDLAALVVRLAKGETLRPGLMGVVPSPEHTGGGVRVDAVAPGSPAAKAGIEAGELITRVGADVTLAPWQLRRALAKLHEGDRVTVEVKRGAALRTVELVLAPVPHEAEGGPPGPHPPGGPGPAPHPPGGGRSP